MVMLPGLVAWSPALSVTLTVKVNVPAAVGVPPRWPPVSTTPGGRLPAATGNPNSPVARAHDACQHLLRADSTGTGGATTPPTATAIGALAITIAVVVAPERFTALLGRGARIDAWSGDEPGGSG